jgi:hypothetical protein
MIDKKTLLHIQSKFLIKVSGMSKQSHPVVSEIIAG